MLSLINLRISRSTVVPTLERHRGSRYLTMKSILFWVCVFLASGTSGTQWRRSSNDINNDRDEGRRFVAKWNVPSAPCINYGRRLNPEQYSIQTNAGQEVNGSVIVLFFSLGIFPRIDNGVWLHGGVPQRGNLSAHLTAAERNINQMIPDVNFNGSAVIDFEDWRPVWDLTAGTQQVYRDASIQLVRKAHPDWSLYEVQRQARLEYETAGRKYLLETLELGKRLRPKGGWGYYGYPYVDNYEIGETNVSRQYQQANDQLAFLINNSTAIYVSIYTFKDSLTANDRSLQVKGRIQETLRVRKLNTIPIIPYWWYSYHEVAQYLTPADVDATIGTVYDYGLNGIVIWGGSGEVNSYDKCNRLNTYLDTVLGPYVKSIITNQ